MVTISSKEITNILELWVGVGSIVQLVPCSQLVSSVVRGMSISEPFVSSYKTYNLPYFSLHKTITILGISSRTLYRQTILILLLRLSTLMVL